LQNKGAAFAKLLVGKIILAARELAEKSPREGGAPRRFGMSELKLRPPKKPAQTMLQAIASLAAEAQGNHVVALESEIIEARCVSVPTWIVRLFAADDMGGCAHLDAAKS